MANDAPAAARLTVAAPLSARDEALLDAPARAFLVELHARFEARRQALLGARAERQRALDAGAATLDFLAETRDVREGDWQVAPPPADLADRRVEITGPVDRKMIINALNSGASAFMADFEDSTAPTWRNVMDGQANLHDAVRGTIRYVDEARGREYALDAHPATLLVRPRGWHLPEKHVTVDGEPISGALFDFGLMIFHNARALIQRGSGPYFYLPKLESHTEAELWNDVFLFAQRSLGIPRGTIRAAVLIETITAVFEMHEILHALREHSAGLNCGRWDYIFSFIKRHRLRADAVMPDRATITMERPFLTAYAKLLIDTCHRRGAHAMGGMAAQIPIRRDTDANARAMARFDADKTREARLGHDGSWVAHPGLVGPAFAIYEEHVDGVNQLGRIDPDLTIGAADLLAVPTGEVTLGGVRDNLAVGIDYLAAWLQGRGCVPINNLMEDTATAEICRTQLWQWRHHGVRTADGITVDDTLLTRLVDELRGDLIDRLGEGGFAGAGYPLAMDLFSGMVRNDALDEFLTLPAYDYL